MHLFKNINYFSDSDICKQDTTSPIDNTNNKDQKDESNIGLMIGAIVAVVFIMIISVLIACFYRKRKNNNKKEKGELIRGKASSLSEVRLKSTSGKNHNIERFPFKLYSNVLTYSAIIWQLET